MPKQLKGRDPIRGPLRWSDTEWAEVQAAVAKSGKSFAEIARKLILVWARRMARAEGVEGKAKGKGKQ